MRSWIRMSYDCFYNWIEGFFFLLKKRGRHHISLRYSNRRSSTLTWFYLKNAIATQVEWWHHLPAAIRWHRVNCVRVVQMWLVESVTNANRPSGICSISIQKDASVVVAICQVRSPCWMCAILSMDSASASDTLLVAVVSVVPTDSMNSNRTVNSDVIVSIN